MEDIDLKKLDKLAMCNSVAKQRQYDAMINKLRYAGNFFSFVSEAKIAALTEKLQKAGVTAFALDVAVERIIENYDKFPSYKVIYEYCKTNMIGIESVKCDRCSGGGLISLYEKKTGRNFAFSCDCANGLQYPAFQRYQDQNLNLFTRLAPTRLGKGVNPYEHLDNSYAIGKNEIDDAFKKLQKKININIS